MLPTEKFFGCCWNDLVFLKHGVGEPQCRFVSVWRSEEFIKTAKNEKRYITTCFSITVLFNAHKKTQSMFFTIILYMCRWGVQKSSPAFSTCSDPRPIWQQSQREGSVLVKCYPSFQRILPSTGLRVTVTMGMAWDGVGSLGYITIHGSLPATTLLPLAFCKSRCQLGSLKALCCQRYLVSKYRI